MPIWKLQCAIAADSTLPRDYVVMTPHFDDSGVGTDPQGLASDLATQLDEWIGVGTREINVKAYDAQGTVPVYPQGDATLNAGSSPTSSSPREVALCLSFYSERNIPRRRGRLYIPAFVGGGVSGGRPEPTMQTFVMNLAPRLEALGGADVDWCVFSKRDNAAYPVTNYWCDNEWDTVRSRGLRATSRVEGTTSED